MKQRNMRLADNEIRTIWRNRAHSPHKMIHCLSELNGCDYYVMRDKCEALGLIAKGAYPNKDEKKDHRLWTPEELELLASMRESGMKCSEIADVLGRPTGGVKAMMWKLAKA